MRGTPAVRSTVVAERMSQTAPCFNRIQMQQAPSRSSTGQPTPRGQATQQAAQQAAPHGQSPPVQQQIGSWEGPAKGMRLLSPRVQKVPTPQTQNVRSTSAESHPLNYMRGQGTGGRREEGSEVRASTVDPLGQAFSRQARHSCSPAVNLRGGCTGQGTVRKDRPLSATRSLVPVDEEEMDEGDRGRVVSGMSGSFKPRGTQSPRASSQSGQAHNVEAAQAARLQYLESELALFTSKMSEMRSVAEALQEEIHTSRPSPTSSITTGTPSGTPSFANASAGDVIEALKKVLSKDNHDSERAFPFRSPSLQNDLMQEVRQLNQDMKLQAEAQKQLTMKMEAMFQEERAKRDEAFQQMEQRWQTSLKEESSLRRAVEGHIEERLASSMREMRMEAGTASAKAQQVVNEFSQLRDNLRQEQNLQKLEIGNASADLSRLIDEVRKAGITGDVASVTSTEMTENLVRAEVRRQLAERCTEAPVDDAMSLEMQALASRLDHLERALENEITSRQEEGSTFLCELHSLMKEQGHSHTKAFQDFEDAFKAKLDAVMSEVQTTKENCLEEEKVRRQQIYQETKDREETAVRILRAVEEKILCETKNCRQALVDQQGRLEDFVTNHGHAINKVVEKNSEELQAAQNDLLQLRDELKEAKDDWKAGSPPFKLTGGGPGPCMEHALDIEELRTQMASERLAREQADDRCMDNIRDMINEEQGKRGRELQALELRLSKKEVCQMGQTTTFGNRPTTSICQTSRPTTLPTTTTMIQVQGAAAALSSFSA
eukprot:s5_g59.t1